MGAGERSAGWPCAPPGQSSWTIFGRKRSPLKPRSVLQDPVHVLSCPIASPAAQSELVCLPHGSIECSRLSFNQHERQEREEQEEEENKPTAIVLSGLGGHTSLLAPALLLLSWRGAGRHGAHGRRRPQARRHLLTSQGSGSGSLPYYRVTP